MITVKRGGERVHGRSLTVAEYEPLEIEVTTDHAPTQTPDVYLEGASIGSPRVWVGPGHFVWTWIFRAESWCGRATLKVDAGDETVDLEVRSIPNGSKLSNDEYDVMLRRVMEYEESLGWGLAPGKEQGTLGTEAHIFATHPNVVAHYLPELLTQLERIIRNPVLGQRRTQTLVSYKPNMPLSPAQINSLASRPDKLERIRLTGGRRVSLLASQRCDTCDHPANRYIVTLLYRLRKALFRTGAALEREASQMEPDTLERARAHSLAAQARIAHTKMGSALESTQLMGLPTGELTESASLVIADNPTYARFARLSRALLHPAVQLSTSGELLSSIRRSFDLFEIYCLFRLAELLEEVLGQDWQFNQEAVRHSVLAEVPQGLFWSAHHADGAEWRLFSQPRFSRSNAEWYTISTERRPDFLLARFSGGLLQRWVLLDAKYRTAKVSISPALESMHIYRDSLRWKHAGGESRPSAGYLLVPRIAPECQWAAEPAYREQQGFGLIEIDEPRSVELLVQA